MKTEGEGIRRVFVAPTDRSSLWQGLNVLVLAPTPTHPIDAGNRRRIFYVNDSLQRLGAKVTYVHYPAEADWRTQVPGDSIRAMSAQWATSYTIPVTRALHEHAVGEDHLIDEWWDPAIGDMLVWLFATNKFDAFIVNYAWLSKSFEYCPSNILKILDTHDRLSGRRDILQKNGIPAEFFHTTVEQEKIALDRANVIWSIKSHEAEFFRSVTNKLVVNIPHAEPFLPVKIRGRPDKVIRFGIAGAQNNINNLNVRAFLLEADTYIRQTLLPCEIVIAGSICDLLKDIHHSWVTFLGRIPDMDDFYSVVDVVLAPIAFSTGLKIKVGEALCKGKAVLALKHAFEGYEPTHAFHELTSVREMLRACKQVVNTPELIGDLELASISSIGKTAGEVATGLDLTIAERWWLDCGICIIISAGDVFHGSLAVDHVRETARYVGHHGNVIIYVHGHNDKLNNDDLNLLTDVGKLVVSPELNETLRLSRAGTIDCKGPLFVRQLGDVLTDPHIVFWFASMVSGWSPASTSSPARAYVAIDSIVQSGIQDQITQFVSCLRETFDEVVILSRRGKPALERSTLASWHHRSPLFWRGDTSGVLHDLRNSVDDRVMLLADEPSDPLLALTVSLVLRLSDRPIQIVVPNCPSSTFRDSRANQGLEDGATLCSRVQMSLGSHCFSEEHSAPYLVLDLASPTSLESVREMIDLGNIPRAEIFSSYVGIFESSLLIEKLLRKNQTSIGQIGHHRDLASRGNDAGWTWIWSEIEELASRVYNHDAIGR